MLYKVRGGANFNLPKSWQRRMQPEIVNVLSETMGKIAIGRQGMFYQLIPANERSLYARKQLTQALANQR